MNPHAHYRKRSGKKRGQYRICKYCCNSAIRNQGLCHECLNRPKEENQRCLAISNAKARLGHFLTQKNISAKNLKTIQSFFDIEDSSLRDYAEIVLAIGQRFPRKKKRYRKIRQRDPELLQRIRQNVDFYWIEDALLPESRFHDDAFYDDAFYDVQFSCEPVDIPCRESWPDEYFSQRLADEEAFESSAKAYGYE
jgi:hypothetical protein